MDHPIASKIPGRLKAVAGKPDARARRNSKTDAALSSQGRLKDVFFGGLMVGVAGKLATDKSQESWEFSESESESWSDHEKEVTGKTVASRNSESSEILKLEAEKWPYHFHRSPVVVLRVGEVCSVVRRGCGRSPTDDLGQDYMENLRFAKNQLLKSLKESFRVTEKLIKDQREITGLTTIDYKQATWRSTTLSCDKAVEIANAQTYVFAPSLGGISDQPVEARQNKIRWYLETLYLKDLNRIDGEQMEFEWKIFPGFTTLGILEEIQKMMTEITV